MKSNRQQPVAAFTLVEMFIVATMLFMLLAIVLPLVSRPRVHQRLWCTNNLKQIGLAFKTWALDNTNCYPMQVSVTNGGTMELATETNAYVHFQVMSNELSTPRVLRCPEDARRRWATNFGLGFSNINISYFVGVDASDANPEAFLAGDRNLTNNAPRVNGLLVLTTNSPVGWNNDLHKLSGNILLADGSVQQLTSSMLRGRLSGTNRLVMP
jgi:competence protein ComGC